MLKITEMNTTIGDFQRNYIYKMVVPEYPASIDALMPDAAAVAENMDLFGTKGVFPESKHKTLKLLWGGEYAYYDGPVDNDGTGVLTLRLDKDWKVYDFWKAWKSLGSNDANGAALPRPLTLGKIETYMVGLDKTTIQKGVELAFVKVNHIEEIAPDKEGDNIALLKVHISWDKRYDLDLKGQGV